MKSKLAILSLIISILSIGLFLFVLYIGHIYNWDIENTVFTNIIILAFVNIYSLSLSKRALKEIKEQKMEGKVFAILGMILSIGILVVSAGMFLMAMVASSISF